MQTAILWYLAEPFFSTERCVLGVHDSIIRFDGSVLHTANGRPCHTYYTVALDMQWRTSYVSITSDTLGLVRKLDLSFDRADTWLVNQDPTPELDGCIDIDLGITPATNTIPIRRLALQPGQSAEVVVAWVRFPALTVERLPQRYTCLAPDRYRYESPNFTATLTVDDQGLVRDYEGVWHAVAHEATA